MTLAIHQFRCLDDNYAFLLRDEATGRVAAVDTPDADALLAEAARLGWTIDVILNTHWHPDHAGGNAAIKAATGATVFAPTEVSGHAPVDHVVCGGNEVTLGETRFSVIDVGGHTLGHIAFHAAADAVVFVGDALFPMGCGRIFEGTPEQMWASLSRLAALPEATRVYSAHEYALGNARFTATIDNSPATIARIGEIEAASAAGVPTVPTTIAIERATNPFLRPTACPAWAELAPVDAFAAVRAAKDSFKG